MHSSNDYLNGYSGTKRKPPCYPGSIARDDIGFPMQIASGS